MKRIAAILALNALYLTVSFAQEPDSTAVAPADSAASAAVTYRDTVVYNRRAQVNEELQFKDIYGAMPEGVTVSNDSLINAAIEARIRENSSTMYNGFRIRIFLDNKKTARDESLEAEAAFRKLFPGYMTYRNFSYPFFKVTVGDFRTKADAMEFLPKVQRHFPAAFIVREQFKYADLDPRNPSVADTLLIMSSND